MTNMTADELRDLAARTYRACVERQARIAKRDEEARRAHAAILARCDEVERELRELRDDHIETLAHLVACVEVLGLPRDTDGPALVEAVRARALPRAEVRAERLERHAQEAARGLVHVHIDEPVSLARGHHIDEPVRDVVERSFYNRDRAAWSERAKRAESQLALAMTWGAELADAARCEAKRAENASAERFATSLVRIIAREPLDPAPQSPPIEIILTSGPAGILFHVADAGSVGVLEDFLRYLGHEIVVDKPATLASPIANTGLDELVREAGEKGDT